MLSADRTLYQNDLRGVMMQRPFQRPIVVLLTVTKMTLALLITLPVGVIVTYFLVFHLYIGEIPMGIVVNNAVVVPLGDFLRAASIPDSGFLATTAGSLFLSFPYAAMVTAAFVWLSRLRHRPTHSTPSGESCGRP